MKKFKQILAFGDSTLTGMGFDPADIWRWDDTTKQSTFPNQLARMLDIPCINTSIPGASNDRSLRLLPEALLTYPDSLVLFCYTFNDRTEQFHSHKSMHNFNYYLPINPVQRETTNTIKLESIAHYYKYVFDDNIDNHNRYTMYNMLLTVQTLCEKYAVDYLQLFMMNEILLEPVFQRPIYNAIDKSHIHTFTFNGVEDSKFNLGFSSFYTWADYHKFRPAYDGVHPGEWAHTKLSEELYIKYTNQGTSS